MKTSP